MSDCIHVIDDDAAVRDSLAMLLQSVGLEVQVYASAEDFLQAAGSIGPACVLLDVRLPDMSGIELLEELTGKQLPLAVIMMTAYGDVPLAVRAMKSGAVDFIEKPIDSEVLLQRIRLCLANKRQLAQAVILRQHHAARLASLTLREKQVLAMLVKGQMSKQIAADLGISIRTVEAHRAHIKDKLGARSLSDIIRIALAASSSLNE